MHLQAARDADAPIADYAAIGDCRSLALVAKDGSIDWLCWPMFSSPALFAALLDRRRGGRFAVTPLRPARVERRYLPETNVLETAFETPEGVVRLTDFMPLVAGESVDELIPARELVRQVEGIAGAVEMAVVFAPRPDFARAPVRLERRGRLGWVCRQRGGAVTLHGDVALEPDGTGQTLVGAFRIEAGARRCLWLSQATGEPMIIPPLGQAGERLAATVAFWHDWIGRCRFCGPHAAAVRRSLLALKLLTYAPSGAVVAAGTASLPEWPGAERNWDYRYTWLRDSCLTFRVFADAGFTREAASFMHWLVLATRLTAPELQVVYDVYGRTDLKERELVDFEGWRGSRPVRLGNDAHRQFQLDLYGEAMATAADFSEWGGKLMPQEQRLVLGWAESVAKLWRRPDHGIWEVRTPPRHFTFSKVMAWATCDALARMIERGRMPASEATCDRLRLLQGEIRATIERRGFDSRRGIYVAAFGEDAVDASLLLLPWFGYRDACDPVMCATLRHVLDRLDRDGLVRRYERGFDGFDADEGAFLACGFWAADCLARSGEIAEAEQRVRHLLGYANDVGLMAEEADPASGELLGNIPQAFSHIALINAAMTLADVQGEGRREGARCCLRR